MMQFNQPSMLAGQSLQQAYQQQNVQQHGQAQIKVPWALSADERKNYDSIFRAWDQQSTGFLSGEPFCQRQSLQRSYLFKVVWPRKCLLRLAFQGMSSCRFGRLHYTAVMRLRRR